MRSDGTARAVAYHHDRAMVAALDEADGLDPTDDSNAMQDLWLVLKWGK